MNVPQFEPVRLKSCPFCGGRAWLQHETVCWPIGRYTVACEICGVKTARAFSTKEAAAEAWNRRTLDGS